MADERAPKSDRAGRAEQPERPAKPEGTITLGRIAIWVIVGGIGAYLLISGIIGIVVKGS